MALRTVLADSDEVNNQTRQAKQKRKIIRTLSTSGGALTITDLQKQVKISTPTIIKLLNELIAEELVVEEGKKETDSGRKPTMYTLNIDKFYALGVEILLKRISISLVRLDQKVVFEKQYKDFRLEDTPECLDKVIGHIRNAFDECGVSKENILGIGIGLTGRVNSLTGETFNYLTFTKVPLARHLSSELDFPVYIDNDTHLIGLAEQVFGQTKEANYALILNVSRGLGMAIIANKKIITGGMGFAGEFGHMQMGNSDKLCICGKRGCLGMEVSGYALEEKFKEAVARGETSLVMETCKDIDEIRYDDILDCAEKGDQLSISLLQSMGETLGMSLGNIVNLFNPEIIIIGGKFARAGYVFSDSIKTGMNKTTLTAPLRFLKIKTSKLDKDIGCRSAATLVFRQLDLL